MSTETTPAAGDAATPALNIEQTSAPAAPQAQDTTSGQPPAEKGANGEQQQQGNEGGESKPRNRVPAPLRIAQLSARLRESRAGQDYWQQEAMKAQQRLAELEQPPADDATYDQREENRLDKVLQRREAETVQARASEAAEKAWAARNETFMATMEDAVDRIPEDTMSKFEKMDVSPFVADRMMRFGDLMPEFVHHFTTNAQLASELHRLTDPQRLSKMSPASAAECLADAAEMMATVRATLKKGTPRKATSAPAPGTTLAGGTPPSAKALTEIGDMNEYAERRKAAWKKGEK